ncbi:hypothetical protein HNR22_000544 [Micromonospora jinlongensis]|uniref:LD-carboxypeptidase N-terminal domain-containing protein n=1 Tax=Micromonospora jinlongensis TaxID=1287877 RepID=A0A7Y9WWG3_9ACTN|nr:LD-carboxypeptidase [Micromonospora jinlongensis]NYH40817.1 hypothetical protein [Micromonospora jinlongensis]
MLRSFGLLDMPSGLPADERGEFPRSLPTNGPRADRAPVLAPGDRVVSPGSTPNPTNMARGIEILRSWGLEVELGRHVFTRYGYLAGTDAQRLADLNAALTDPGIRAVFAARGGYGTVEPGVRPR